MIISDPKGEIYKYTHVFLEQQGYNVHVLNFLNPIAKGSKTWNPFHVINRFIQEKDYNQANILIHFLANTILNVANQGQKGSDPFWTKLQRHTLSQRSTRCVMTPILRSMRRHFTT